MSKELNKAPVEQAEPASCQGTNCGTTTGDHSSECLAEAAASQGWELKPGDLCGRDCPMRPDPVEQAGGDERAVDGKPRATKCPDCGEGDLMPGDLCACGYETDPAAGYACSECDGSGDGYVGEVCRECDGSGWFVTPEQARAALAQPSGEVVVTKNESGAIVSVTRQDKEGRVLSVIAESATLTAQAEKAEVERPEVVGYLATAEHPKHGQPHKAFNYFKDQHDAQVAHWRERGCTVTEDRLMTVSQHDRIFWALRADRDSWAEQAEQRLADWDEMRKERDAALARVAELKTMADNYCALLMDANAKLAEMERQEPVALANRGLHAFWVKWTEAAAGLYGPGLKLYASPVAQAQHSVPVAREQLERLVRILDAHNYAKDAEALMALLAAAPGKEGV
ncbi:hypothetical protein SOK29_25445 [Pseudomonas aeruginosa]|uniref:hypothetical protein n=1 Tax=Pseudomonas aeruginosa TaxID=287 RepID=UPI002A6A694B|nr:hypothetical protein [Pseudomonas aeruginosa]MDY1510701.1 hypothetical protein [Pseudomonas aeruginosa]